MPVSYTHLDVYKRQGHEYGRIELCTFTPAFKRLIFPRLRQAFEAPTRVRIPIDVEMCIRDSRYPVRQDRQENSRRSFY